MQTLLKETGGFDNRVFWGSFGRENEETMMKDSKVRKWYYESDQAYNEIRQIKKRVDPEGMFTTEFTVQYP